MQEMRVLYWGFAPAEKRKNFLNSPYAIAPVLTGRGQQGRQSRWCVRMEQNRPNAGFQMTNFEKGRLKAE